MRSNFILTEAEQKVLDTVRQLLGSNLADYLLSGLGETNIAHCRAFIAQSTSRHSANVIYQFDIINESEQGLPMEREKSGSINLSTARYVFRSERS
jgi:hypothetical protein